MYQPNQSIGFGLRERQTSTTFIPYKLCSVQDVYGSVGCVGQILTVRYIPTKPEHWVRIDRARPKQFLSHKQIVQCVGCVWNVGCVGQELIMKLISTQQQHLYLETQNLTSFIPYTKSVWIYQTKDKLEGSLQLVLDQTNIGYQSLSFEHETFKCVV